MSRAVLAGLLVCVLTLVSCVTLSRLVDLGAEVEDAGYTNVRTNVDPTTGALEIDVLTPDGQATADDADTIAEIAWTRYRDGFDELHITIDGTITSTATAGDLTEKFGERPAGLVEPPDEGPNFTLVVVLVLVVMVLFTALVFYIWWRGRRRPPPPPPPTYPPIHTVYRIPPYQPPPPPG